MEQRIARMQDLVRAAREVRNRYSLDTKLNLEMLVRCNEMVSRDFQLLTPFVNALAGVAKLECGPEIRKPSQAATVIHADFEAHVSLRGLVDVAVESKRLEKQLAEKQKHLQSTQAKLANSAFVDKAPAEVVHQQRDLINELQCQIDTIRENLSDLRAPDSR